MKKWAEIVKLFDGRTENALKNRYSILIDKQIKENKLPKKTSEEKVLHHFLKRNKIMVKQSDMEEESVHKNDGRETKNQLFVEDFSTKKVDEEQ